MIDLSRRTPLRNGDIIVHVHRRAVERDVDQREIATWLTSTPILTTAPQMMREGEKRGGSDGDNLSAIIVRWGPETLTDEQTHRRSPRRWASASSRPQIDRTLTLTDRKGTQRDLTDDEIEHAIEEIQSTIQKYRR